jgi:hypothetical protein
MATNDAPTVFKLQLSDGCSLQLRRRMAHINTPDTSGHVGRCCWRSFFRIRFDG